MQHLPTLSLSGLLLAACTAQEPITLIQVRGSDSEVNLVQRLGEAYTAEQPGVAVAVTGGGSGVGIAALIDDTADVANSSRPIGAEEKLLAIRRGGLPVATLFATDALTVIVHEDNPVGSLSLTDLGQMFDGTDTAWPDDTRLTCYGRQSSSGTYVFFRDAVVAGDFGPRVLQMNGNAQIVEAVAADPGGIGYVAVGYLKAGAIGVRAVPIRDADGIGIDPLDVDAVLAGRYPLARPLYQYTNHEPTGAVRDFLRWELTPPAEAIIDQMGFYPLVHEWRRHNDHLTLPDG